MFKAELDRMHHAEQMKDYLREAENSGQVMRRRAKVMQGGWVGFLVLCAAAVCVFAAVLAYGNEALLAVAH